LWLDCQLGPAAAFSGAWRIAHFAEEEDEQSNFPVNSLLFPVPFLGESL
jgi:hypothetical protein